MSLLNTPEQHGSSSGAEQSGQIRVRDLLRACGAARDRRERAALLARVADQLDLAADDIATDATRAEQYREFIAGLRGQAGMARIAAAFDDQHQREHSTAC